MQTFDSCFSCWWNFQLNHQQSANSLDQQSNDVRVYWSCLELVPRWCPADGCGGGTWWRYWGVFLQVITRWTKIPQRLELVTGEKICFLAYLVMMQFPGICLKCGHFGAISSQSFVAVLSSLLLYRHSDERDCYLHQDETPKDCLIKFSKSIQVLYKDILNNVYYELSCVRGIVQHVLGYLLGLFSDDLTWKWFNTGLFKRQFEVATKYLFWVVQCFWSKITQKWNDLAM